MARPKNQQPTPAELEVLQILWDEGPMTVRQVMQKLQGQRKRAYTTVMSLLNVMTEKRLVKRTEQGRAFVYGPVGSRDKTLGSMVKDLLKRGFEGSSTALVAQLLDHSQPSQEELDEIRKLLDQHASRETNND